jgi:PAS domain-containing protein
MPHERQHNDGVGGQGDRLSELKSAALEATANAIAITDREGIIVWINTAFHQLTGFSSEEVIGQSIRLLKSGRHPASFYKSLWDTILSGEKWQGHIVGRTRLHAATSRPEQPGLDCDFQSSRRIYLRERRHAKDDRMPARRAHRKAFWHDLLT